MAKAQVLLNFIQNTIAMASVDYSVHSKELTIAAVTSAQQPPADLMANSGAHHLTSLQDLKSAGHSQDESHVSQGRNGEITMPMPLLKGMRNLQHLFDST